MTSARRNPRRNARRNTRVPPPAGRPRLATAVPATSSTQPALTFAEELNGIFTRMIREDQGLFFFHGEDAV